jgi:hypothetical protein
MPKRYNWLREFVMNQPKPARADALPTPEAQLEAILIARVEEAASVEMNEADRKRMREEFYRRVGPADCEFEQR